MIHGGFVILASLASLAAWRLTDVERENVERVLGAAGDGIYGVDAVGRITFVNPMLCELVGRDADALQGEHHHVALGHASGVRRGRGGLRPLHCGRRQGAAGHRRHCTCAASAT